jgi:hypothetical protein
MASIFRLNYLFTILLPALFGIFIGKVGIVSAFPTLVGWSFLAISQNVLNDYFDKDRDSGVSGKCLLGFFAGFSFLGLLSFFGDPQKMLLPILYQALMILYNWRLKPVPVVSIVLQVFAYVVLPLVFYSPTLPYAYPIMFFSLFLMGSVSELMHEVADRQSTFFLLGSRSVLAVRILLATDIAMFAYDYLSGGPFGMISILITFFFVLAFVCLGIKDWEKDFKPFATYSFSAVTVFFFAYLIGIGLI